MAVSAFPRCLALVVCVFVTLASSATTPSPTTDTTASSTGTATNPVDDIKEGAMQMISDLRLFTDNARKGMTVSAISQYAQDLEENAAELLQQIPNGADGCKTNLVIKMAAARTGSHEILTLLQAGDELEVLSGRLSLSLAFLESVTRLMEDELALSTDIGGHLAAIIFGTDMTDAIANASDALLVVTTSNDNSAVKRQSWKLSASPSYSKGAGLGISGTASYTSKNGRTGLSVTPSWTQNGGFAASGNLNWKSPSGRTSVSVSPSYSRNGGFGVGSSLNWKSSSGRTTLSVSPSYSRGSGFGVGATLGFRF